MIISSIDISLSKMQFLDRHSPMFSGQHESEVKKLPMIAEEQSDGSDG